MRQKNREVSNREELLEIMRRCDVCRLALNNEGYPYIVPMNFGLSVDEDKISLIFHSALEGMKLDLIRKDNRASFEMDGKHQLQYFEEQGYCTMAYERAAPVYWCKLNRANGSTFRYNVKRPNPT